jgi:predicted lipoprotein with Yx(FWY)xxD motif
MRTAAPATLVLSASFLIGACSGGGGAAVTAPASVAVPSMATSGSAAASASAMTSESPSASASAMTSESPSASASAMTSDTPSASAAAGPAKVMTAKSKLGTIVVDGQGRTLYALTKDPANKSTCYDQCAAAWPPLTTNGPVQPGKGVDAGDFTTFKRTDGSEQVSFYSHPLYHFASDSAPGETNGEGVAGVWFVVAPNGQPIKP